jgi:hypothetical protein
MDTSWKYKAGLTLDEARKEVKAILALRRYDAEQSGTVTVDGHTFGTSRDERASLTVAISLGLPQQTRKLVDGTWVSLTLAQLIAVLSEIQIAVQSLYDDEAAESVVINNLTLGQILTQYP